MGAFDVLVSETKARLGNRQDIDSRLPIWVNDAYFELLLKPTFSFYELDRKGFFDTTADVRSYDIVTLFPDLWFTLSVRDNTNQIDLRRVHIETLDRTATAKGRPNRYARFHNEIELDPTPDGSYTIQIRYRTRPADLVSGANTATNREWDEVLIVMATVKGYEALEQPEKASAARELLNPLLFARGDVPELEDMDSETTISVVRRRR